MESSKRYSSLPILTNHSNKVTFLDVQDKNKDFDNNSNLNSDTGLKELISKLSTPQRLKKSILTITNLIHTLEIAEEVNKIITALNNHSSNETTSNNASSQIQINESAK